MRTAFTHTPLNQVVLQFRDMWQGCTRTWPLLLRFCWYRVHSLIAGTQPPTAALHCFCSITASYCCGTQLSPQLSPPKWHYHCLSPVRLLSSATMPHHHRRLCPRTRHENLVISHFSYVLSTRLSPPQIRRSTAVPRDSDPFLQYQSLSS